MSEQYKARLAKYAISILSLPHKNETENLKKQVTAFLESQYKEAANAETSIDHRLDSVVERVKSMAR